jgi:hypothetical protein
MKIDARRHPLAAEAATLATAASKVAQSSRTAPDTFSKAPPSSSLGPGGAVGLLPKKAQRAVLQVLAKQSHALEGLIGSAPAEVKGRISEEVDEMIALGKRVLAGGLTLRDTGFLQHVLQAGGGAAATDEGVDLKYISNDGSLGTELWSKVTGQPRGPQTLPEYVDQAVADADRTPIRSIEFCGHGTGGLQNLGQTACLARTCVHHSLRSRGTPSASSVTRWRPMGRSSSVAATWPKALRRRS